MPNSGTKIPFVVGLTIIIVVAALILLTIFYTISINIQSVMIPSTSTDYNLDYFHYKNLNMINEIDWHNRKAMAIDRLRLGIGEQGKPAYVSENTILTKMIPFTQHGYNAQLSDIISLDRSVPDNRHPLCDSVKYRNELPNVTIIIPFYNEHWSVLLRTICSVLNRTPPNLIDKIIIVDDFSDDDLLIKNLDNFLSKNLSKIKIVRHNKRRGLIAAILSGSKNAKGEVLVILHSHVEPNYNWLPPLLEPIAYNRKIAVCPIIDIIDCHSFAYRTQGEGSRDGFDWELNYKRLPLLPDDLKDPVKPYFNPVMQSGLFAINRKWFWELGGYDTELYISTGAQYELSFKIWMCGGVIIQAPCSRVGYLYRDKMIYNNSRTTTYSVHRNYKRIAEVWMDEYAKFVYDRRRTVYDEIDAGDLSYRKAIRNGLNCKSFKWYMEKIAFDIIKRYPPVEPPSYAYGIIQSMADDKLCLDTLNHENGEEPGLYPCTTTDPTFGLGNQNWEISWYKDLRLRNADICLDLTNHQKYGKLSLYSCHKEQGNQCWFYDHKNNLLKQGHTGFCIEANIAARTVYVNECNESNINMKWKFGFYNSTALEDFDNVNILKKVN